MLTISYSDLYPHTLPDGHRFPMLKYDLIPQQLLHEGIITSHQILTPKKCEEEILLLTHSRAYIDSLKYGTIDPSHMRRIGFPWSKDLYIREITLVKGTIDCALMAMKHGVSLNVAGGTHHAFSDKGEGFCLFNDIAVAANYLIDRKKVSQILIIDLDVHQGNGTASIFQSNQSVFTFSMHGKDNYPFHKELSDMDVPLENGISDEDYLALLLNSLDNIERIFKPELIFYLSGVDILATDRYGKLNVTIEGCKKRDEIVFKFAKKLNVPVACAMGGGYSPQIVDIVNAHVNTFKVASNLFS
jgi:acetoin utilization deacetylase AcuC-like enzyme